MKLSSQLFGENTPQTENADFSAFFTITDNGEYQLQAVLQG